MAVPIYSYILDIIDEFLGNSSNSSDLKNAARQAKTKLEQYYPTADGLVYVIGTSILFNLTFRVGRGVFRISFLFDKYTNEQVFTFK